MRRNQYRNKRAGQIPRLRGRHRGPIARSAPAVLVTGGTVLLAGTVIACWSWSGHPQYRSTAGPGHGRGMSQVGAFDSAQDGWTAERILDHYYPGATLGQILPTTVAVRLTQQDDSTLDTFADAGGWVAGRALAAGQAAHLTALPDGRANVVVTIGCDGEVVWQSSTDDPWVYPVDPGSNRPAAEHLRLCGGSAYRGALGVATEDGAARTVNRVEVEDYLLGVVPAEVQANWADKGAAEALRAQAIAARSYALAEQRYPYADTCDTTDCQVYPGTDKEDPRAAAAVANTAGTVLLRDGRILRSEYSSAPDGGQPADITTFDVGPAPDELEPALGESDSVPSRSGTGEQSGAGVPTDPRTRTSVGESPIDVEYRRLGGVNSSVGQPIGPEMELPEHAGIYRLFSNGVIVATPTLGAQVVDFTRLMELVPEGADASTSGSTGPSTGPSTGQVPSVVAPGAVTPNTASTPVPRPTPGPIITSGAGNEQQP
ncbi:SpoIID/LytB domain-containing protein [Nocardia australiensis]|uniref:SpoIID/LytB domain-containing protein n=1 Tax=Nocardia australiensis TaxID=2887191 RepID=UPI001D139277|nr:SpoIID/LytB domain-containing protein [Nocardia australiensis]